MRDPQVAAANRVMAKMEGRIAELEADYARAEDITKRAHATAKKAMEQNAELEAERDRHATNSDLQMERAIKAEAERDKLANNLRMSTDFTDGLFKRIAELEAELDKLHKATAELRQDFTDLVHEKEKLKVELAGVCAGAAAMTEEWRIERDKLRDELETERIRTKIAINAERQDCSNIVYDAYITLTARNQRPKEEEPCQTPPSPPASPQSTSSEPPDASPIRTT